MRLIDLASKRTNEFEKWYGRKLTGVERMAVVEKMYWYEFFKIEVDYEMY